MKTKYEFLKKWYLAFDQTKKYKFFFQKQRKAKIYFFFQLWKENSYKNRAIKEFLYAKRFKMMKNLFSCLRSITDMKKEKKVFYQTIFRRMLLKKYLRILKNTIVTQMKINEFVNEFFIIFLFI